MNETETERLAWLGASVKDSVGFGARTTEELGGDAEEFVRAIVRLVSGIVPATFENELADAEQRISAEYAAKLAAIEQRMVAEREAMWLEMERRLAEQNNQFNLRLAATETRRNRRHPWALVLGLLGMVVGAVFWPVLVWGFMPRAVTDNTPGDWVMLAHMHAWLVVVVGVGWFTAIGAFIGRFIDMFREARHNKNDEEARKRAEAENENLRVSA